MQKKQSTKEKMKNDQVYMGVYFFYANTTKILKKKVLIIPQSKMKQIVH